MTKVILFGIIFLLLITGCNNSYDSCKNDCMNFNAYNSCELDTQKVFKTCYNKTFEIEQEKLCYNECKQT